MSIATSPLAWQFTWMPARCTRSTQALSSSCVSVTLPLYGGVDARIRRAQRHRALGERAVDGVLRRRAELDPLVAEAGHDAAGDHRVEHAAARLVAHAVHADRRARAPAAAPAGRRLRGARWSGRSGRTASRCARARRARAARVCSAVNVGRLPTLLNTSRARSVTRPFSSPFASRSKVPPGGFGVFFVTPAISSALLL